MAGFIFEVLNAIFSFVLFVLFAYMIMSWLIAFNIINTRNPAIWQISHFLDRVTSPILEPFRRIIPPLGGLDFSYLIAVVIIGAIQHNFLDYRHMLMLQQLIG